MLGVYRVSERYVIKGRGFVVCVEPLVPPPGPDLGDTLYSGDRAWIIQGVEMMGRQPTAYLLGGSAPEVGATVRFGPPLVDEIERLRRRIAELESDRARLDDTLARAYRSE